MMDFVDREELLRRLDQGFADFNALLDEIPRERMTVPDVAGKWSVKDLLAHFIAHEQRAVDEVLHALRDEPYHFDHSCNDAFNEGAVIVYRLKSYDEVYASWMQSVETTIEFVGRLSDADFDPEGAVVSALDDTIDGALANNTYDHWSEHAVQVEAWLHQG